MTFPRYPAYKDSGVEWLGEIPSHWKAMPLKSAVLQRDGAIKTGPFGSQLVASEMLEGEIKVYNQRNVIERNLGIGENYISKRKFEELRTFEVFPGDVLITTRGTIGRCIIVPKDAEQGILHPCLMRVQTDQEMLLREFLVRIIEESGLMQAQLELLSNATTIEVIYSDTMRRMVFPIPPLPEQRAIAAFLDAETARIDALVAKQEALITTLQEKRRALISHAVTKGLDPTAPMKDSGVPWLGEVPAHWEVKPIKYLVKMESGGTPDKSNLEYWDGTVPWASAKDLKLELLRDTEDHITQHAIDSGVASLVAEESVIIVVRGMILLHTLPVTVNLVPVAINQDLKALHAIEGLSSFFLAWSLRGLADAFLARTDTAGHGTKALRTEDWNDVELGLPPLDEQRVITNYIDQETLQIDTLIARAQAFIALLREHRAALIAAAVTGQIDVRGYVADVKAPAYPEEVSL